MLTWLCSVTDLDGRNRSTLSPSVLQHCYMSHKHSKLYFKLTNEGEEPVCVLACMLFEHFNL